MKKIILLTLITSSNAIACDDVNGKIPAILLLLASLILPVIVYMLLKKFAKKVNKRLAVLISFLILCIGLYFSLPEFFQQFSIKCSSIINDAKFEP